MSRNERPYEGSPELTHPAYPQRTYQMGHRGDGKATGFKDPSERTDSALSTTWSGDLSASDQPASRPISLGGWFVRGLGLVAISIISGLLWLVANPTASRPESAPSPPAGLYPFRLELREEGRQGCQNVSTQKIKKFFATHRCEHLTRALYTVTLPGGQRVLTSVVAVRMPDAESARALNAATSRDETGNIKDLASDGRDIPDDFPKLEHDVGYASQQQDRLVVVGESAYFHKSGEYEDEQLRNVTRDALRLGQPQDTGSPS